MEQRSKTGGKTANAKSRNRARLKRHRSQPKAASAHCPTPPDEESEIVRVIRERDEALEREKALAEVLRIINSSPGDVEPVFQGILANAVRICDSNFGVLFRYEKDCFEPLAQFGLPPALAEFDRAGGSVRPVPGTILDRVVHAKDVIHIADDAASHRPSAAARLGGARSIVSVPMFKKDALVGAINIYRQEVRPFTDKQIELVRNFAAQAVIAIENARLLKELRESLEGQTATSNILRAIASSPGDVEGSLRKIAETTARLFGAVGVSFRIAEGDVLKLSVGVGQGAEQISEALYADPAARLTVAGRNLPGTVIRESRQIHLPDLDHLDEEFADWPGPPVARRAGIRTMVGTPLRTKSGAIGALIVYRNVLQPFEAAELELLQSFADQAAIAIENARLLNQLRQRTDDLAEALEQQTATSEVLKVISSSPGNLQPIFIAMLENATRICEATFGGIFEVSDHGPKLLAEIGLPPEFAAFLQRDKPSAGPQHPHNRVVATRRTLHILDYREDQAYVECDPMAVGGVEIGGIRTLLVVPMLKDDILIGVIATFRQEVRPFTVKQIELVENFAAQAVIAIENARLLSELRQRTADLSKSLDDLRAAQDRLVQTQKLASLGQLTAGIAHEIKNPLNFVNNFSGVSVELIDELREALQRASADDKTRAEIDDLADTLRANLDKIAQHGKRADTIVKNMLMHSREGSDELRSVDINALVDEALNLAYHGARAEKQGFNIALERSFDPAAGKMEAFPQEITRVLLNLISNGFYAATKRQSQEGNNGFEPTITAVTKDLGDRVEIKIRDNGTGIPPEVREKMFNPFFTTKPAGEGTGLGLSISHDIIVKQHLGFIEVDTAPGEFTEFRIILPRSTA